MCSDHQIYLDNQKWILHRQADTGGWQFIGPNAGRGNSVPHSHTWHRDVVKELIVISDGFVVELWKQKFGSPFFEVTAPLTSLQDTEDAFPTHFHERDLLSRARETETLQRIWHTLVEQNIPSLKHLLIFESFWLFWKVPFLQKSKNLWHSPNSCSVLEGLGVGGFFCLVLSQFQ